MEVKGKTQVQGDGIAAIDGAVDHNQELTVEPASGMERQVPAPQNLPRQHPTLLLPVIDEVQYQLRKHHIEMELMAAFAGAMLPTLQEDIQHKRYGCEIVGNDGKFYDHPSQVQHVRDDGRSSTSRHMCFALLCEKITTESMLYECGFWMLCVWNLHSLK